MNLARRTGAIGRRHYWLLLAGGFVIFATAVLVPVIRLVKPGDIAGVRLGQEQWMMGDFKSTAYFPARAFADGENPYDVGRYTARYPAPEPFRFYPPVTLLLHLPIASFPIEVASTLQFAVTVLLTGVLALLSLRLAGGPTAPSAVLAVWGLILLSRPGHWNLLLGQSTLPVVLACYIAVALDRRRFLLAGIALAVALLKPSFGLPLTVIMLARGQVVAVSAGLAFTALVNVPVVMVLAARSGGVGRLLQMMVGESHVIQTLSLGLNRIDMTALLARWSDRSIGAEGALVVVAAVLGFAVWALRFKRRHAPTAHPTVDATESGLIFSALLLCTYHITYDFLLLTWPLISLTLVLRGAGTSFPARRWVALSLLVVIAFNYLSSQNALTAVEAGDSLWLILASINGVALLALFLLYLYDAARPALHARGIEPEPAL